MKFRQLPQTLTLSWHIQPTKSREGWALALSGIALSWSAAYLLSLLH